MIVRWVVLAAWCGFLPGAETIGHPFRGVTYIERAETTPRAVRMHVVEIELSAPGIAFKVSPPGGRLETVRQTTLEYMLQEGAQIAINAHYFLPWPSQQPEALLVGFAASNGTVYSGFEIPEQSYALTPYAPALNIDAANHASIVHRDPAFADGRHVIEKVAVWNAVAGSAQIVTDGVKTIPTYAPEGVLRAGGPNGYSSAKSWYAQVNARTAIGISKDGGRLVLFTVDARGGSAGMTVGEVADVLISDFDVYQALNLDGGGSTTLALDGKIVNVPSDSPKGRSLGSSLAVFAAQ